MINVRKQSGLTLMSTLLVGAFLAATLILGLKLVPVFTEYFAVKSAFAKVIRDTNVTSPPSTFRSAFRRYADVDDIDSVDAELIVVSKSNGKASMAIDYERRVKLFANASLVLSFSVDTAGVAAGEP